MQADVDAGLVPMFLCTSMGTTPTTAVDPIHDLCAVASPHGVWVHVDAAYAGSALICPEFRQPKKQFHTVGCVPGLSRTSKMCCGIRATLHFIAKNTL